MLIDSHCHLDFESFDKDRPMVLARAEQAGVELILNPSMDVENSARVASLAEGNGPVYAAVGVHPNEASSWEQESKSRLKELTRRTKVVAIGEIGLDYYWDKTPKKLQHRVLTEQLELAAEMELPVIIHNREAGPDVLGLLLDWQAGLVQSGFPLAEQPGVLHSFSAGREIAEQAIAANFYIGFTGPITFKNAKDLQAIAKDLPLDRILVETDSPFLSPHPERGQRNEPAKVKLVAEKLAELKGLLFEEVAITTTANAKRLFHFGDRQ